jgi:quercetin dioxygenase-like cupin family protein
MTGLNLPADVIDGGSFETVRYPDDELRLRVAGNGDLEVIEYISTDREGPPAHSHPWDEVEYVIEGEAEFLVDGTWTRGGPGTVQLLPAGSPHSVRVPEGTARILMIAIGAPFAPFARELAALYASPDASLDGVVEVARRHGLGLA